MDNDFSNAAPARIPAPRELVDAVNRGNTAAVKDLLRRRVNVREADGLMGNGPRGMGGTGYTALGWAAHEGYREIVTLLLDAGADIDGGDRRGDTPLMLALWNYKAGVAQLLAGRGAALDIRNNCGKTVLEMAEGHGDMGEVLAKAIEDRQRALRDAETARINAGHALALGRQKILYARAPRLTIT